MPTLLFYYPEKEKRWRVEVEQERFTIGRSREVEVCIPHSSVSKKHLLVERRGPRYFFRDLGSKNGIYLNDFRKQRGTLNDGDELRLGSIRITFYTAAAPESVLSPPSPAPPVAASSIDEALAEGPIDGDRDVGREAIAETTALPAIETPSPVPDLDVDVDVDLDGDLEPVPEGEETASGAAPSEDAASVEMGDGIEEVDLPPARPRRQPLAHSEPAVNAARNGVSPPRRISPILLLLGAVACVGLGLFLGHLGALLDDSPPTTNGPGTETAASAPAPAAPPKAPAPASAPAADKESPPAELSDAETRTRLIVRLYLDLLDRPPTREEVEKISTFAHDRLWNEVVTRAGFRPGEGAEKVFMRFLGRKSQAGEVDAILAAAGRDMDHFAFRIGTSKDYASADHRRRRSVRQLSRSLIVDLLDVVPTSEVSAKVLGELEDSKGAVAPAAGALARSDDSRAGPRAGEKPDAWLVSAYERLLLRNPSAEEKRRGLEAIAGKEGGWREVLAEIAGREEYLRY